LDTVLSSPQNLRSTSPAKRINKRGWTLFAPLKAIEYDIFFKVKKLGKGRLEMIVETAFVRDPAHAASRPSGKPIRFWIILHNTLHGLKIRS
jgi:hypothetical protein